MATVEKTVCTNGHKLTMLNWRQYVGLQEFDLSVGVIYTAGKAPNGGLAIHKHGIQLRHSEEEIALMIHTALNSLPLFETEDDTADIYEQMQARHRVDLAVKCLAGDIVPTGEYKKFDNGVVYIPCHTYQKPIIVAHDQRERFGMYISNQLHEMGYVFRVDKN